MIGPKFKPKGNDGDMVDVFIGPHPESDLVFIVDQIDPNTNQFDEHKVLIGWENEQTARAGYLANYDIDWKGFGGITAMGWDEFTEWLKTGTGDPAVEEKPPIMPSVVDFHPPDPMTGEPQEKSLKGKFHKPENYDRIRDLPDGREFWAGANDWECGWSRAWIQGKGQKVGYGHAPPEKWIEIDHSKCPGCKGENSTGEVKKEDEQACISFAKEQAEQWLKSQTEKAMSALSETSGGALVPPAQQGPLIKMKRNRGFIADAKGLMAVRRKYHVSPEHRRLCESQGKPNGTTADGTGYGDGGSTPYNKSTCTPGHNPERDGCSKETDEEWNARMDREEKEQKKRDEQARRDQGPRRRVQHGTWRQTEPQLGAMNRHTQYGDEKSISEGIQSVASFLARRWAALEERYGRRAALTMAVASVVSFPVPFNITAIVAAAEAIRGVSGYFSKSFSNSYLGSIKPRVQVSESLLYRTKKKSLSTVKELSTGPKSHEGEACESGWSASRTGCIPAKQGSSAKRPSVPQSPFKARNGNNPPKQVQTRSGTPQEPSKDYDDAMDRWLKPEERSSWQESGDTPFKVTDKNGKVVGYTLDENFAEKMAKKHRGKYDFDEEKTPKTPETRHEHAQEGPQAPAKPKTDYAPPPEGERLTEPPCCLYDPDPNPRPGEVAKYSRVGVPADQSPPPPREIPRLPNLTEKERKAETDFAEAYLADPDGVVEELNKRRNKVVGKDENGNPKYQIGDGPNVFSTDDAKVLSPDYNPQGVSEDENKNARGTFNTPLHQTANAIAKRAFLSYLDTLPEDKKTVLVTAGGCASGKSFACSKVAKVSNLVKSVGAVWDAAGEANSTENSWILDECKKRDIVPTFVFVNANPNETWENPKRGVVQRANVQGRMVDHTLFSESYSLGAKNFDAFHKAHKDDAEFFILDNSGPETKILDHVPESALNVDGDELKRRTIKVLQERKADLRPGVVRGGSVGERIWGRPGTEGQKSIFSYQTKAMKKGTCKVGQNPKRDHCSKAGEEFISEMGKIQEAVDKKKQSGDEPTSDVASDMDKMLKQGIGIGGDVYNNDPKAKYHTPIEYVLAEGQKFTGSPLPPDISLGTVKECFRNATLLVIENPGWKYAEGFAMPPNLLPVLHGWCVTPEGKVIDNTFRDPEKCAYHGVVYDRDKFIKHMYKAKFYGLLGGRNKDAVQILARGGL
jgi:hypothetical protein